MKCVLFIVTAVGDLRVASAWGEEGHAAVAYIAQNLISSETISRTQSILGDTLSDWLASIASWADDYRYTDCNVDYDRDCGEEGCSISALVNYTQRVTDGRLSADHVAEALKFVVHLLGDFHQPLHDENLEVGGNDIDITFNGISTELHAVWDTLMIEQQSGAQALAHAQAWAQTLTNDIQTGPYAFEASTWSQGMDINNVQASVMLWASDANSYVFSVVMPNCLSAVRGSDLYPDYLQLGYSHSQFASCTR